MSIEAFPIPTRYPSTNFYYFPTGEPETKTNPWTILKPYSIVKWNRGERRDYGESKLVEFSALF